MEKWQAELYGTPLWLLQTFIGVVIVHTADFRTAAHYFRPPVLARAPALFEPQQSAQNRVDGGAFLAAAFARSAFQRAQHLFLQRSLQRPARQKPQRFLVFRFTQRPFAGCAHRE